MSGVFWAGARLSLLARSGACGGGEGVSLGTAGDVALCCGAAGVGASLWSAGEGVTLGTAGSTLGGAVWKMVASCFRALILSSPNGKKGAPGCGCSSA